MKVLVTGGCGFIGSHLVDKLIELEHYVFVIDNLSASENEKFYFNEKAKYFENDISDTDTFNNKELSDVEIVFHLAAESRIQPAIKNPIRAHMVNVIGTLNVLEFCKKNNIKKLIYSSTSSVYGLTDKMPISEDTEIDCLNPYSHSKYLGEQLISHYNKIFGLNSIILRYFNVFGERSPIKGQYAPVVGIFLNQFSNQLPLTIVGDGSKRRDFIHVSDVVKANILSMYIDTENSENIFNVGTNINYSIKEIADVISNRQIFLEERSGEALNTLANITKIENILGFDPSINIIDWIKKEIKKEIN